MNKDNTQLSAEVVKKIWLEAEKYAEEKVKAINEEHFSVYNAYIAGATEYATKLHEVEQENKDLKETVTEIRKSHAALNDKLIGTLHERHELQAKCDRYEALIKRIYKDRAGNAEVIEEVNETLSAGEGKEAVTEVDLQFMRDCDLHPHSNFSAKILTGNDEGAHLEKDDLLKLAAILYKYANQKEDQ